MKGKILNLSNIILVIILLSIPLALISLNSELIIGDELWNFQNIAKMLDGGKIYIDNNVIITPIFYIIGYCFVKFITGTILGFRIYNIIIFLGLLLSSFLLFRSLKIDKLKSFMYTLFVFLIIMPYISVGANYNILVETIFVFGIVLFLNKDKIKFYDLCQGFIIFACIFTKQNIGLYYYIAVIIAEFITNKKQSVYSIIRETIVVVILALLSILIMYFTGCLEGFLNYTFLGMSEFATKNIQFKNIASGYLIVAVCSYALAFIESIQNKEIVNDLKVLSIFSVLLNLSAFPIVNLYHSTFAIFINIIIYIYIVEKLLFEKINKKIVLTGIIAFIYIGINSYGIFCGYKASKNIKIVDKSNIYFSVNISKKLNQDLKDVSKYIKQKENEGKDVVCITPDAALYMTYLHKSHGELDLCFVGNLGYNGKEKIIHKVQELDKDTEILVGKEKHWQEVYELKAFVKKSYKKIDQVGETEVYIKQ